MLGPANQRLPPIFTHWSRRGADGPEKGFVPSTPKIRERRGERTLASTRHTGRELLAARVLPAMAQTELLPFSPSTPQITTCRGARPLADKNIRWMSRNISSPLAFVVRGERMGTASIPVTRSVAADMGLSVMPASIPSWVINLKLRLMEAASRWLDASRFLSPAAAPEARSSVLPLYGLDRSASD